MGGSKIDVHHHIIPPQLKKAWNESPALSQGLGLPPWSPEQSLEFMARHNISASILSLAVPTISTGKDSAAIATFCHDMNDYVATLCRQYPTKFGFFATLPSLEDVTACVAEIRYALEDLGANGVNLFTSYGGKYLGHPDFQAVWDELDRHAAVVFIHPGFEGSEGSIKEPQPVPAPVLDWTHETSRTAAHLIATDTVRTHPACRVILPHGGGTLPYVVNRIAQLSAKIGLTKKTPAEFVEEAKNFYFDLALAGYEEPLGLLLDFARPGHVLYGTDYPFVGDDLVASQGQNVEAALEDRADASLIRQGGALEIWPRLGNL